MRSTREARRIYAGHLMRNGNTGWGWFTGHDGHGPNGEHYLSLIGERVATVRRGTFGTWTAVVPGMCQIYRASLPAAKKAAEDAVRAWLDQALCRVSCSINAGEAKP